MASSSKEVTLIGVCDGWIDARSYRTSYLTNKVGGQPDSLPVISLPRARCSRCGTPLALVVQIYCPLQASPYHRTLHVFACPGVQCGGSADSWTVFRSQCTEPEAARTSRKPLPAPQAQQRATDWCEAADDWGEEQEDPGGGGETDGSGEKEEEVIHTDVSNRLEDLHLEGPEDTPVFCPYFISVIEESDLEEEEDGLAHAQELLREYERREGVAVGELMGGEDGAAEEQYEKTRARHGDDVFSRFMKMISLCPEQILRYCHGGQPLLVSQLPSDMEHVVLACGSCGGSRMFELQLMPALVNLLQRREGGAPAQLEFGTVLVYTCTKSCWTVGACSAVEEFCFVQMDPDQKFFK
ncbi:programmed cell death protein 2-like [Thalassophryne amazonica]|uniref:programmed cell death protein 2-like n=1 Tax=Thalassophryne amazonica TaxID=390379 RepID=UPI0014713E4D|nr:programmed cell death protein 2-like [Thalassophryne amazonica]